MNKLPPIEELKRLFHYDPETGSLTWKIRRQRMRVGDEAGFVQSSGYRRVKVNASNFKGHRICYAIFHGVDPYPMEVDHINHNRSDNRIQNLRLVSHRENGKNQKKHAHNTSGYAGVSWRKQNKKWHARITVNGKKKHLGYFTNKSDAIAARRAAEEKYNFHENHGDREDQQHTPAPEVQLALFRPVATRPQQEQRA